MKCWDWSASDVAESLCASVSGGFIYVGETSRSLKERSEEHIAGAHRLDMNNFICKHWQNKHEAENEPPVFIFKVSKVHRDPLSREVDEAVKIQSVMRFTKILNSKSKWNSPRIG